MLILSTYLLEDLFEPCSGISLARLSQTHFSIDNNVYPQIVFQKVIRDFVVSLYSHTHIIS